MWRGSTGRSSSSSAQDERFWDEEDGGWFSTTGDDPTRAAAPQRGLRRRGAFGERHLGVEPADPDAPGAIGAVAPANRADAGPPRPSRRRRRARRSDAAVRPVGLARRPLSGRRRRRPRARTRPWRSSASWPPTICRSRFTCRWRPRRRRPSRRAWSSSAAMTAERGRCRLRVPDFACQQPVGASRRRWRPLLESEPNLVNRTQTHVPPCPDRDTMHTEPSNMTFDVEIVLRERNYAVTQQLPFPGRAAARRPTGPTRMSSSC